MQALLNQLVYLSFFQALLLLAVYGLSPTQRKRINGYILVFIALLAVGLLGRVLYLTGLVADNYRWVIFSEFATLLFGPTIYLFTQSALLKRPASYHHGWHYLPAVLFNVGVVFTFMLPSDETLQMRAASGEQFRNIVLFVGVGLVFNLTYWVMSVRSFQQFRRTLSSEMSYMIKTKFFLLFLLAIGGCMLTWLVLYVGGIFGLPMFNRVVWQVIWISIALLILFIAVYALQAPELFTVVPPVESPKYAQSKFSATELDALKDRLEQLMAAKKPYLNRKLLKSELANLLGVSSPELARLLNERIGMNFFEYVNYYRIKEFIELAKTDRAQELTFFGLAQEAGFNSKTTFNKAFKKIVGRSPSEYFRGVS
ncbi:helix-turn-helix domain-containing protein [Tunicatimonas pelagia]|uniref:helix-turn-helix domain-containing protein n=1 Tax=Tunicatimonas pelagia TaxID=931531 RepID=UPI002666C9D8|nr:helix-turn-helix domain-containing protein [Tunicatimonas pelagia]WKN45117.1 helix-turn-helix domain-containing protein [Tunicatimonas pelagia]